MWNLPYPYADTLMEYWSRHPPAHISLDRLCHAILKDRDGSDYNPEGRAEHPEMDENQAMVQLEMFARSIHAPTRDVSTLPPAVRAGLKEALAKASRVVSQFEIP